MADGRCEALTCCFKAPRVDEEEGSQGDATAAAVSVHDETLTTSCSIQQDGLRGMFKVESNRSNRPVKDSQKEMPRISEANLFPGSVQESIVPTPREDSGGDETDPPILNMEHDVEPKAKEEDKTEAEDAVPATECSMAMCEKSKDEPLLWWHILVIYSACLISSAIVIACFSTMGAGLDFYCLMAPKEFNMIGNLCVVGWAIWMCVLYVVDVHHLHLLVRAPLILIALGLLLAATALKAISYPWAPLLIVILVEPTVVAELRAFHAYGVKRRPFYEMTALATFVSGLLSLIVWLVWMFASDNLWNDDTKDRLIADSSEIYKNVYSDYELVYARDCGPNSVASGTEVSQSLVAKACAKALTVWFISYVAPFVVASTNIVISLFCFVSARIAGEDRSPRLFDILRKLVLGLTGLVTGMYCSVYVSGSAAKLATAFMAFFTAAAASMIVWVYLEVPHAMINQMTTVALHSKLGEYLVKAWKSDWIRAMGLGAVNVLLPFFILLDRARQMVRRCRGKTDSKDSLTEAGRVLVNELMTWNLCGILVKVNLLGELWFCFVVGMRVTYVFFSWLNWDVLAPVGFGLVLFLVVIIGFIMFLLPPVPGSAVYMFSGIVIGAKGQVPGSVGFWPATIIAIVLGGFTKLAACVGQYMIGYSLGKSVKVQSMIGVDQVPTRAIEYILRQQGLKLGKVAILVGGPDWPVSVSCGILKLNIPQMVLGTLPVVLVSVAPQTTMAAMLTMTDGDSATELLASVCTAVSLIFQVAAMLVAAYYTTQTIERMGTELAKHREEHRAVEELREKEKAYNEAFSEATRWTNLPNMRKAIIILAASFQLLGGFIFTADMAVTEKVCFRPFEIKDNINHPIEAGGLGGDVFELAYPLGRVAIVIYVLGFFLHWLHVRGAKQLALARMP